MAGKGVVAGVEEHLMSEAVEVVPGEECTGAGEVEVGLVVPQNLVRTRQWNPVLVQEAVLTCLPWISI